MRSSALLVAALAALTTLPVSAQQVEAAAQAGGGSAAAGAGAAGAPNTAYARAGRPLFIHAELMGKLDSKTARVGDPVVLRVQETVRGADGSAVLKGARIVGQVTAVSAHTKGSQEARVTVLFDRAEVKGAEDRPIRAQIQWAEPMPSPSTADALRSQQDMGGGVMGDAAHVAGGMQSGGLGAGTAGGMTVSGGMMQMTARQTAGLGSAADYGLEAPLAVKSETVAAHSVLSAGGRAAPSVRATGVPGVMLASDPAGDDSGTFLAAKQNVRLEGATRMVLAVTALR